MFNISNQSVLPKQTPAIPQAPPISETSPISHSSLTAKVSKTQLNLDKHLSDQDQQQKPVSNPGTVTSATTVNF